RCGIGSWGGQRPSPADYVAGMNEAHRRGAITAGKVLKLATLFGSPAAVLSLLSKAGAGRRAPMEGNDWGALGAQNNPAHWRAHAPHCGNGGWFGFRNRCVSS